MKYYLCLLAAVCLLSAGCTKNEPTNNEQSKSVESDQPPPTNTPAMGQFGKGTNPEGGSDAPSDVRVGPGGDGRAGGGNFDPAAIFNAMDTDGDGKLTGDEIPDRLKTNLDAMDADKDGSITLEEQQAWFQKRMTEGGFGKVSGGGGDFRGPETDPLNSVEPKSVK